MADSINIGKLAGEQVKSTILRNLKVHEVVLLLAQRIDNDGQPCSEARRLAEVIFALVYSRNPDQARIITNQLEAIPLLPRP
jgi:hypothetical protein